MKRKFFILMLVICSMLLASCTSQALKIGEEVSADAKDGSYKLGDYEKAVALLDKHLKEASPEKTMVAKNDEIQIMKLERLNENYYLASYQISPIYPLTNLNYALVGFRENSCRTINLDTVDYISDTSYDNGVISFYSEGNNIVNAFREFPHNINYDIKNGELSIEQLYHSLESGSQVRLGNGINKAGIKNIAETDKEITFDFEEVEGTILAGGAFCPAIKSGVMFDKEDKPVFYLDFENLILSKENEKMIMDLAKKEYISGVDIKHYEDLTENSHTAIYFRFKGVSEYTCSFKNDDKTGFENFILILR
ncbi:outer membrane protein assembly factor BamD [Lutispora saccharofermentans]|uniref:Lipoprotein n=1 Tax=Lutispora saccharofermentans TaxID=3024236 RepID=A0ABT1NJ80_9FIRM|nr:hypothetical protein [Lutispora saccharofermentans]MCQ1531342.1 hypothetical protein [Lutispora saccharofermentans]